MRSRPSKTWWDCHTSAVKDICADPMYRTEILVNMVLLSQGLPQPGGTGRRPGGNMPSKAAGVHTSHRAYPGHRQKIKPEAVSGPHTRQEGNGLAQP
eukprot:4664225-Karenia_brevis.AAC.1